MNGAYAPPLTAPPAFAEWEREVSLDYLMNEKFVQLTEPEQLEEYLFTACGQTAVLYHAQSPGHEPMRQHRLIRLRLSPKPR